MDFKCEKVSTSSDPCPTGYRLPTLEEWLALLGGCEESYWGGSWDCNNCYQSSTCSALLGITEDTRFDWEEESDVATGTVIDGDRYLVDLEYGDVRRSEKSSACAYCVRDSS